MDLIYILSGGFVVLIFILKMELLIETRSFRIIFWISLALFLLGLVLHFTEVGRRHTLSGSPVVPLITLGLFQLCRNVFLKRFDREPRDTFLNWSSGMVADRVFNIVYFAAAAWLWLLIPIGMDLLMKAGW
jgi:hypothetical protein